jgi:hypothetical protein
LADDERDLEFTLVVPPELGAGTYANFMNAWHTAHEFTLDFAVAEEPVVPEDPDEPAHVQAWLASRLKIPVTLVLDVLRTLSREMTEYEERYGEIRPPGTGPADG